MSAASDWQEETYLSSTLTVADYRKLEENRHRAKISKFLRQRFTERYVVPAKAVKEKKHGFAIMALSCLMIESLECFYRGWDTTPNRKGKSAFCGFFERTARFDGLHGRCGDFYRHVRCGILHQGETTGGWRIQRRGDLFDEVTLTINASEFLMRLEAALDAYCKDLRESSWTDEIWERFREKMAAVCSNCDPLGPVQPQRKE